MIAHGRLNLNFRITEIQKELSALLQKQWQGHYNRAHYTGNWEVLSLLQSDDHVGSILAEPLNQKTAVNQKFIGQIPNLADLINGLKCDKKSVRLLNLKAGAMIKPHKDIDLAYEKGEVRLHIPIFTNPKVDFRLNGERLKMFEGECWYINANLTHEVTNNGTGDRIHLVIDCIVNDWIRGVFTNSPVTNLVETVDADTQRSIIAELRLQNNATSKQLADLLENELDAG